MGVVRDVNGSATGFVAVSRVVTDRLESERRLQAQLERYRQIADAVPGMTVWIVDRDLRCRFAAGAGFAFDRGRPGHAVSTGRFGVC